MRAHLKGIKPDAELDDKTRDAVERCLEQISEAAKKLGPMIEERQPRWKVERLFAWLQNFRRLVTRYERHVEYLHEQWFTSLVDAQVKIETFRVEYKRNTATAVWAA